VNVSKPPSDHPSPEAYRHPFGWALDLPPMSMPGLLERSVAANPAAPLAWFYGRRYSYRAILAEARAFAAGLQRRGIGKGDRVGLFLPNVPTYPIAYYGAMIAGATVVNFSPLYTAAELAAQVEDSRARVLVTIDSELLMPRALEVLDGSSLETLVVASFAAQLPWHLGLAFRLFQRSKLFPPPRRADVIHWRDVLGPGSGWGDPAPVTLDPERDIALLQYTGGTTGTPKGAMLTHQNLTANARQIVHIDPWRGEADVIMGALPLFHVFANACCLNRTVARGGCIVLVPRFEAGEVLETLERSRSTAFPGVPTMYQALLDHPRLARTDFSKLKICVSGGAPLPAPLRERFEAATGARLVEGYGLTECSGVASTNPYQGEQRPGTIGQPIPETRMRLVDKEDPSADPPPGEPGELVIAGPQIMQGYWNRPDTDATAFVVRDDIKWLRTGDVATIDDDGFVRIVDRLKDMIAVGGFKVFPSQLEEALLRHPAVHEALVLGLPDPYHGEMPHGYVTLREGADAASGEAIREWVNQRIGKHERLAEVVVRQSLPKTIIGKLDRKALRSEVTGAA
jgi:long-chain acyl-CoA synthetase